MKTSKAGWVSCDTNVSFHRSNPNTGVLNQIFFRKLAKTWKKIDSWITVLRRPSLSVKVDSCRELLFDCLTTACWAKKTKAWKTSKRHFFAKHLVLFKQTTFKADSHEIRPKTRCSVSTCSAASSCHACEKYGMWFCKSIVSFVLCHLEVGLILLLRSVVGEYSEKILKCKMMKRTSDNEKHRWQGRIWSSMMLVQWCSRC